MKILCLSNGHGEDAIALRILQALQQHPCHPTVVALPLVGEGRAFMDNEIPIVGRVKKMPSGGFIYMDGRQLARDLRGGLLQLTVAQWQIVQRWAKSGGAVLAVGDIVPLLFAWMSGAPYAFVGTAKSEYYVRDEAGVLPRKSWFDDRLERWTDSIYHPWERWLMSRRRCRAVFPRDTLTTNWLKQRSIAAFDLGNPMMDGLKLNPTDAEADAETDRPSAPSFVLLPGSRPPEAYENWQIILQAVGNLVTAFQNKPVLFLGAIAPTLDLQPLCQRLTAHSWHPHPDRSDTFTQGSATLVLSQSTFSDCLHQADFAIAMSGTATEQFVGLGKPALILPGKGPQFTPAFAEAQTRLLGASAILLKAPTQAPSVVRSLLKDPDRLHLISENGRRRMGEPGAAQRIAECLIDRWSNLS